jgi:glycosyltransferase involved in cell wall biosynthesis
MPNYNHGRYLRDALGAILTQSVRPLEVLVIDDCSTDDSVAIIREIAAGDPVVRLLVNPRNMGVNPTVNRGLHEATGDFVFVSCADDHILPGFVEKSMNLLAQHRKAKLCLTDHVQFDTVTGKARPLRLPLVPGYLDAVGVAHRMKRRRIYTLGATAIMERAAFLQMGCYPPELGWITDVFTTMVLAFRYGACYVPENLFAKRLIADSYGHAGARDSAAELALVRKLFDLLQTPEYGDVLAPTRESGALCLLGSRILPVLAEAKYRSLVSVQLLIGLVANIPVTLFGLNPATESPLRFLDRAVRGALGLDSYIQKYGVQLDSPARDARD